MQRVGLIGLGDMGIGMAENILKHGFELTGYDLREERRKELTRLGGKAASGCREVGENSDTVLIMVLDGQQVKEVVFGDAGLLAGLKTGSTIIVTSTINPGGVKDLHGPLSENGIKLLDSPVSGGKSGADNGTLTLMTAGPESVLEDARAILEAVGQDIFAGGFAGQRFAKRTLGLHHGQLWRSVRCARAPDLPTGGRGARVHRGKADIGRGRPGHRLGN